MCSLLEQFEEGEMVYRNLPNRGAGCDSKVKSDTMG